MADTLSVKVTSPDELIWEGQADAVSSENAEGKFDILPEHANFITLIKDKEIKVHRSDGVRTFSFDRAVIYNTSDEVTIYANLAPATVSSNGESAEENESSANPAKKKNEGRG